MMAGNPNSWWSMQYPPSHQTLYLPNPHHHHHHHHHQTYVLGSSSLPVFNYSLPEHHAQDPPQSWSHLLLGSSNNTTTTTGLSGDEDRYGNSNSSTTLSHHNFQPGKLENWEEDQILNGNNSAPRLPGVAAAAVDHHHHHHHDVKQEVSQMKHNLMYGQGQEEEYLQQAINKSSGTVWSSKQVVMPVSSPKSCVTSLGSNNMLDFSYNKPDNGIGRNQNTDHSSECNSTATGGVVSKKARVQARSSSQPPLKVRKEKLGDRITALHQLVSPFGKTDTASVLLEAIGYIRFLQSQIEALSSPYLGHASKNIRNNQQYVDGQGDHEKPKDLRSRGLCLVPVSCTQHVGSDNGADYWAPAAYGSGF